MQSYVHTLHREICTTYTAVETLIRQTNHKLQLQPHRPGDVHNESHVACSPPTESFVRRTKIQEPSCTRNGAETSNVNLLSCAHCPLAASCNIRSCGNSHPKDNKTKQRQVLVDLLSQARCPPNASYVVRSYSRGSSHTTGNDTEKRAMNLLLRVHCPPRASYYVRGVRNPHTQATVHRHAL